MSAAESFAPNHLRKSYRVRLPSFAIIKGKKYDVLDWSYDGFGVELRGVRLDLKPGEITAVKLLLPFKSHEITLRFVGELVWCAEGGAGFRITMMEQESRDLIKRYVVSAQEKGESVGLSGPDAANDKVIPTNTEVKLNPAEQRALKRTRRWRLPVSALLGALGLFLSAQLFSQLQYMESVSAEVVGQTFEVRAPADGTIKQVLVDEKEAFAAGQPLVVMDDGDIEVNLLHKRRAAERLRAAVEELERTVSRGEAQSSSYRAIAQQNLEIKQKALRSLEAKLGFAKAELDRSTQLLEKSLIPASKRDADKAAYEELIEQKGQLQEEIELQRILVAEASKGHSYKNGEFRDAVAEARTELSLQQAKLAALEEEIALLEAARRHATLVSPAAGQAVTLKRTSGEQVKKGEPILVGVKQGTLWVDAVFQEQDARRLALDAPVQVEVPALGQTVVGAVESFDSRQAGPASTREIGAPTAALASLRIRIPSPSAGLEHGQRVRVAAKPVRLGWF